MSTPVIKGYQDSGFGQDVSRNPDLMAGDSLSRGSDGLWWPGARVVPGLGAFSFAISLIQPAQASQFKSIQRAAAASNASRGTDAANGAGRLPSESRLSMLLRPRLISALLAVIAIAQAFAEEAALSEIEVLVQSPQSAPETFIPLANAAPDSEVAKACRALVSEIEKKEVEIPKDRFTDTHFSHSEWYRGKGYIARIHIGNWAREGEPRLGAYIEFLFAAGDCRYALGGVEWTKAQDDQGRDLANSLNPVQGRAGQQRYLSMTAVHPDHKSGSANISLSLPDKQIASFAVLKGVSEFMFAARWERITLKDFSRKGYENAFEQGHLHLQCLGYETREKRAGCFFRLDKLPGFRPIPFVPFGDPHFLATIEDAAGHRKDVEFGIWSRTGDSWDYYVEGQPVPDSRLHVALLTDVALVRAPFEFRNVPIPPAADAAPPKKQP